MAVVQQNAFHNGRTQLGHTFGEPGGDMAAMEGRVGISGSLHNLIFSPVSSQRTEAICSGHLPRQRMTYTNGLQATLLRLQVHLGIRHLANIPDLKIVACTRQAAPDIAGMDPFSLSR